MSIRPPSMEMEPDSFGVSMVSRGASGNGSVSRAVAVPASAAGAAGVVAAPSAAGVVVAAVSCGNHCGNSMGPATNQPRITRKLSAEARMRFLF